MRFTIISCSTSGCVSPVRFMVPSSSTTAWTVGKLVLCSGGERTDSMVGMLQARGTRGCCGGAAAPRASLLAPAPAPTQYLLMSVPQRSAWLRSWGLLRPARVSPSFRSECSMAVQEAGERRTPGTMMGGRGDAEASPGPREATQGGESGRRVTEAGPDGSMHCF